MFKPHVLISVHAQDRESFDRLSEKTSATHTEPAEFDEQAGFLCDYKFHSLMEAASFVTIAEDTAGVLQLSITTVLREDEKDSEEENAIQTNA